ncbi:hypothetical protein DEU56DRAFT_755025 [Suillus clintonianus]|uniref:uncharacterized protein n=1 Tax=Suillus clintonianus TaxID=1904413 RepID=UPI001B86B6B4|nr:uncharacterized protein DEU56DRAFT_755025 [Suillus clintonianus]KAG2141322.1 hypothetical protein DEU56DRAFT_755025 [Suillus clintonianus]
MVVAIIPIATLPPTSTYEGKDELMFDNNTIPHANEPGLTLLADTALNNEADVSRTPILDPNLVDAHSRIAQHENDSTVNTLEGENAQLLSLHDALTTIKRTGNANDHDIKNSDEKLNVFFVHPMPENPPMYSHLSAPYSSSVFPP